MSKKNVTNIPTIGLWKLRRAPVGLLRRAADWQTRAPVQVPNSSGSGLDRFVGLHTCSEIQVIA